MIYSWIGKFYFETKFNSVIFILPVKRCAKCLDVTGVKVHATNSNILYYYSFSKQRYTYISSITVLSRCITVFYEGYLTRMRKVYSCKILQDQDLCVSNL